MATGDIVKYRDSLTDKIWQSAQIQKAHNDRSYEILNPGGNVIRRNSRFLIPDKTRSKLETVPCDIPSPENVIAHPLIHSPAPMHDPQHNSSKKSMNSEETFESRRFSRLASKELVNYASMCKK